MKKVFPTLLLASVLLSGCGKNGFQSLSSLPLNGTSSQGSQGSGSPGDGSSGSNVDNPANWEKANVDGYPTGGTYTGRLVMYVDKEKQSLLLVLPIPALVPSFANVPVPNLDGAYLTTHTDADGNISLAVNLPLKHVLKGAAFMPNQNLPNGDPLPFVPAGELPGFALEFPNMRNNQIHIYIGVNVAAVFAELPDFGLPVGGIFPVRNTTKTKVIGAIGYVLPKNNYSGGMYLAAQIPAEVARVINDLIRW
jgi:hypothetical protein